jgi:hypothetical protein
MKLGSHAGALPTGTLFTGFPLASPNYRIVRRWRDLEITIDGVKYLGTMLRKPDISADAREGYAWTFAGSPVGGGAPRNWTPLQLADTTVTNVVWDDSDPQTSIEMERGRVGGYTATLGIESK